MKGKVEPVFTTEEKNRIKEHINNPDNYLFDIDVSMVQELTAILDRDDGSDNEAIKRDIK
jgi:hypothetical protein